MNFFVNIQEKTKKEEEDETKKMSNKNEKQILPLGKLNINLLKKIFDSYQDPDILTILKESNVEDKYKDSKKRVELGFSIGEDAALIDMGDKYLVTKTDPITFVTNEIGYYVVNVNANDIASMGAVPKWFQATILLPESKSTPESTQKICLDIQKACLSIGVVLTGGHTEVTYGLDRPIVVGCMFGEVPKDKYVKTSGGKPGDAIILTKGVMIEGTSIIAREKEQFLKEQGLSIDFIEKSKDFLHNPGISVIKEALLAVDNFKIHSMHDPTEGGFAMGLVEMAQASNCGVLVQKKNIIISDEAKTLCKLFDLDPLCVISSGALLIALDDNDANGLIELLKNNGISASKIGNLTDSGKYKIKIDGELRDLKYSEKDQITRIFND